MTKAVRLAREWTQAQPAIDQNRLRFGAAWLGARSEVVCRSDAAWNIEGRRSGMVRIFTEWERTVMFRIPNFFKI